MPGRGARVAVVGMCRPWLCVRRPWLRVVHVLQLESSPAYEPVASAELRDNCRDRIYDASRYFAVSVDCVHFAVQAYSRSGETDVLLCFHGRIGQLASRFQWVRFRIQGSHVIL